MSKTKADYLIIGQGIAGTWLAYEMLKKELSVIIYDEDKEETSSKRAAGIYNPITGRKMVKTWRADDLFLDLENSYQSIEESFGHSFLHQTPVYRPFKTIEDQNDWDGRIADNHFESYLKDIPKKHIGIEQINDPFGGIILKNSGYVDIPQMLKSAKQYLENKGVYRNKVFDYSRMNLKEDTVQYEGEEFKKIIFCNGLGDNPYWKLPFRPVRGEIMDIQCDLKSEFIINQGVFMIPKKDRITVGSTYDHNNLTFEPQEAGIKSLSERLRKLYFGNFKIIEKRAGVRPATHDRKPYIGLHPVNKTLGIFNGFGTKGVSLAPYFAKHFVDVLIGKCEIDEEVNVQRVF
ncbi:FAD-dependent oxidoreductase [Ekhidna sp.]|uniref:NAD(P)/FAD-dependent oxidoreductase n=1 Tax=Ekhidna sp. TaxID=2608089 RepID=UPI0032975DF8